MLNLLNLKINDIKKHIKYSENLNKQSNVKHFSPAVKEWNNSIYAFNKNTLNTIPVTSKTVIRLIKCYFNLYNRKLESKLRRNKLRIRKRKFSTHKIYISNGEFKHTNNKVIINVYVYNRQKYNYMSRIINNKKKINLRKSKKNISLKKNFWTKITNKKLNKIRLLNNQTWSERFFLRKLLKIKKKANIMLKKIKNKRFILIRKFKWENKFKIFENHYYKKYVKKALRREIKNLYYRRLLLLNNSKFKFTYLQNLTNLIKKFYNKNIEFNIINLKYFFFNSDIFTDTIINKITKKRRKLLRILKRSIGKVKITNTKLIEKNENKEYIKKLLLINSFNNNNSTLSLYYNDNLDIINNLLYKSFSKNIINSNKSLEKLVLNNVKYKIITGARVEAAGRLSKRHTASRSLYKVKYIGSLKNKDSSFKNLSSLMLRGHIRSNLQITKRNSTVNIGSFGIKGWISNN